MARRCGCLTQGFVVTYTEGCMLDSSICMRARHRIHLIDPEAVRGNTSGSVSIGVLGPHSSTPCYC